MGRNLRRWDAIIIKVLREHWPKPMVRFGLESLETR